MNHTQQERKGGRDNTAEPAIGSEDEQHTLRSTGRKKNRTCCYQHFAPDSVLCDNDKISNHNGRFYRAVLCHEILPVFIVLYCLDLVPCDFWLFPTLKCRLRERFFPSDVDVVQEVQQIFDNIPLSGGLQGRPFQLDIDMMQEVQQIFGRIQSK